MVKSIAEIAVNAPLKKLFHYSVPEAMADRLRIGDRVLVPFGPRMTTGVCVAFPDEAQVEELKPIRDVLRADCRLDPHVLELTRWLAEYYHAGWGEVLEAAVPPPVKKGKPPRMVRWISSERSAGELAEEAENLGSKAAARARILSFVAEAPGPHRRSDLLQRLGCTSAALKPLVTAGWLKEEQLPAEPTAEWTRRSLGSPVGHHRPCTPIKSARCK